MNTPSIIFIILLCLKYPASPPDRLPTTKTSTVVVKSNPNVQGRDSLINCVTGVGKDTNDGPKSNTKSLRQKEMYCVNKGWSRPYSSFNAQIVS